MKDWRKRVTQKGWTQTPTGNSLVAEARALESVPRPTQQPPPALRMAQENRGDLLQTIEAEIIPRLMLAMHPASVERSPSDQERLPPDMEDIIELAAAVLRDDGSASEQVDYWMESTWDFELVALELLAPTAHHLGQLWEADILDFTDVTIGTWRLHQLMQQASVSLPVPASLEDPRKRVLLLTAPGEQHSFGISMVAEFFRRDGWELTLLAPSTPALLERSLRSEWFSVVALSVTADARLSVLPETIKLIRKSSRNRAVAVMVGGRAVSGNEEVAREAGADTTAVNARDALEKAQFLLSQTDVFG